MNTAIRAVLLVLAATVLSACASQPAPSIGASPGPHTVRPVATYSIVARDGKTGEIGVAVQSHWFSVGPVVPWAEAGVGAVATQSLVEVSYGPRGLELMRDGDRAGDSLDRLISQDDASAIRQVAMVDAQGGVAVHTGERCIAEAGHAINKLEDGTAYSCQANLMRRKGVPEAMAAAFEATADKPLAERLVAALRAAEGAGGDIRGKQSAALIVVRAEATNRPWSDRLVDLRIEDHADPITELERLLRLHRAYERMNVGDLAMEKNDIDAAVREYGAARALAPGNAEMAFWAAVSLINAQRIDEAEPLLREAYRDTAGDWRETLRRLPRSGLLPDEPALIERLVNL